MGCSLRTRIIDTIDFGSNFIVIKSHYVHCSVNSLLAEKERGNQALTPARARIDEIVAAIKNGHITRR